MSSTVVWAPSAKPLAANNLFPSGWGILQSSFPVGSLEPFQKYLLSTGKFFPKRGWKKSANESITQLQYQLRSPVSKPFNKPTILIASPTPTCRPRTFRHHPELSSDDQCDTESCSLSPSIESCTKKNLANFICLSFH